MPEKVVASDLLPHGNVDGIVFDIVGIAHAIDATHRCHHNHISAAGEQRSDRAEAQAVDFLVDLQVFFYVFVGGGNVGFGLIIVVVRHKIVHRVFGEKGFEFTIELGGKRFVVRQNERRFFRTLNNVRHSERLAGARHPEQRLVGHPCHHAVG